MNGFEPATLIITRGENPWQGMTSNHEQEEANKHIASSDLRGLSVDGFPHLKNYDIPDRLLVKMKSVPRVVMNSLYFSDLLKVDGTRREPGGTQVIGYFKDIGFKRLSPRRLTLFLIESQIIQTYWHVEAELSLISEEETGEHYSTRFSGQHVFFTNERNTSQLDFTVSIGKKDGRMILIT